MDVHKEAIVIAVLSSSISGGVETWQGEASKELPRAEPFSYAALGSMGTSS